MNMQKMLIGVATTAVGFAFGLWVFNKFLVGKSMVTQAAETAPSSGSEEE